METDEQDLADTGILLEIEKGSGISGLDPSHDEGKSVSNNPSDDDSENSSDDNRENPLDPEKFDKGQITNADQSDNDTDNEALMKEVDPLIGGVQGDTNSGVENQVILQDQATRKAMFSYFICISAMCVTVFIMQINFMTS